MALRRGRAARTASSCGRWSAGQRIKLKDGTILTSKGDEVGIIRPGSTTFVPLVLDEHIVFDNTLFIPPQGTKHRSIKGELGHYRLDLGDGYLLHGTPYTTRSAPR